MKRMVPPTFPEDIRSVSWHRYIQKRQLSDPLSIMNGIGKCDRPAPIMANQMYRPQAQVVMNKLNDIRRDSFIVVSLRRSAGLTKTAEIRGDNPIIFRQNWNDIPPHITGLRPAMLQHNRVAGSGAHIMKGHIPKPDII